MAKISMKQDGAPIVIAEVAQTHDGSLGLAHSFIDAVGTAGADAIKFQTHIAAEESTQREPWRVSFSRQDATRYDYWQRMEFTAEQWAGLKSHAEERGLIFMSSPFSLQAVDLLERIGIQQWKVGSGEIDNWVLIDRLVQTRKPILISTGMSDFPEIDALYERLKTDGAEFSFFHCTSEYPVSPENIGLHLIEEFRKRYQVPIGFSSHIPSVGIDFAAIVMGARLLEIHVCFDRKQFGPDVSSSLTMEELSQLVQMKNQYVASLETKRTKGEIVSLMRETRAIFRKSIVARSDLPEGRKVEFSDLAFKKPGDGLPVAEYAKVVGATTKRAINKDEAIQLKDLDHEETSSR